MRTTIGVIQRFGSLIKENFLTNIRLFSVASEYNSDTLGTRQRIPVPTNSVRPDLSEFGLNSGYAGCTLLVLLKPSALPPAPWDELTVPGLCCAAEALRCWASLACLVFVAPSITKTSPGSQKGRLEKEMVALSKLLINQKYSVVPGVSSFALDGGTQGLIRLLHPLHSTDPEPTETDVTEKLQSVFDLPE